MHSILTTLHTHLNLVSFAIQLLVLSLLAFGWILGHSHSEYAQMLKRPSGDGSLVAGLCSFLVLLLGAAMLVDSLWFHDYGRLPFLAGWLFAALVVATLCQWLSQHAAHQVLLADGYDYTLVE